jgi:hypothetical protein
MFTSRIQFCIPYFGRHFVLVLLSGVGTDVLPRFPRCLRPSSQAGHAREKKPSPRGPQHIVPARAVLYYSLDPAENSLGYAASGRPTRSTCLPCVQLVIIFLFVYFKLREIFIVLFMATTFRLTSIQSSHGIGGLCRCSHVQWHPDISLQPTSWVRPDRQTRRKFRPCLSLPLRQIWGLTKKVEHQSCYQ